MCALLREVYQLVHIKWKCASPYHCQIDSQVEGFPEELVEGVRWPWDKRLGWVLCRICSLSIERFPRSWPACFFPLWTTLCLGDEKASRCLQGSLDRRGRQSDSMVTQVVEMRERLNEMVATQDATQLPQERRMQLVLLVRYQTYNSYWSATRTLMCMSSNFLLLGITTNLPNQANSLSYATVRYIHLQHNNNHIPGLDSVLQVT